MSRHVFDGDQFPEDFEKRARGHVSWRRYRVLGKRMAGRFGHVSYINPDPLGLSSRIEDRVSGEQSCDLLYFRLSRETALSSIFSSEIPPKK